jgi:hypothetical protein
MASADGRVVGDVKYMILFHGERLPPARSWRIHPAMGRLQVI